MQIIRMLVFMSSVCIISPIVGAAQESGMRIIFIPPYVDTQRIAEAHLLRGNDSGRSWTVLVWPKGADTPPASPRVLQRSSNCGDCFKRVLDRVRKS